MPIEYLDKNDYWEAEIAWQPLRKWYRNGDIGVDLSEFFRTSNGIYRFEGRYENRKDKTLLYIGIAYEQTFDDRLHQGYHEKKIKYRKAKDVSVSVGSITLNNTINTRKRYEEIEQLLIYFVDPELNVRKKTWCPECFFKVINSGHRGVLPRKIIYPVAEVKY